MPTEKKKVSIKELLAEEIEKPLMPKKIMQAVAYENLVKQQYYKDKEFRNMVMKLRNALFMGKISPGQLREYFKKALRESVDRTAIRWITVEFYMPQKKKVKKKAKKKKVKKKKGKKK